MKPNRFEGIATGRLDVMGGIADYSGSLVLQKPINETTVVTFIPRTDGLIVARTFSKEEDVDVFIIEYQKLLLNGEVNYEYAKSIFKLNTGGSWAAYVVGCLLVLQKEKKIKILGGEFEIRSEIPEGKGVSSSAALEIATMKAISKYFKLSFLGTEMAILAQIVENQIVGAPCGLMDQLACCFGNKNEILPILCQPDILLPSIQIPSNIHFIGIDSGTRHHVGGNSYSDVRKAAFMGYSIVANHLEVPNNEIIKARKTNIKQHLPFKGYLTNISKEEWLNLYSQILPNSMYGHEYIENFENTIDPITSIIPEKYYSIKACASHPVLENDRIKKFHEIFKNLVITKNIEEDLKKIGLLMYESHKSYTSVQLGSSATDRLVELAKENANNGIFGAKITGGGSGGTVCILAEGDKGLETVHKIFNQYQNEIGKEIKMFV